MAKKKKLTKQRSYLSQIFVALVSMALSASMLGLLMLALIYQSLPDVKTLLSVSYQEPMRVMTSEGVLIAEYGQYRRIPLTFDDFPKPLIQAIVATEDQRFFTHSGIDPWGIVRAAFAVLREGDKVQGASTITMQVARNFFLDKDKTIIRKIKEILLSFEIELYLSKQEILELYCNQIFFGHRAYGVEAAARTYYGRSVKELKVPELAMLAGIPQAPSKHNPLRNKERALARRNHVLERMYQVGYLSHADYQHYLKAPNTVVVEKVEQSLEAMHVADLVRQYWVARWGEEAYTRGLEIRTTLVAHYQKAAHEAVVRGMQEKRGVPFQSPHRDPKSVQAWLASARLPSSYDWGVVTEVGDKTAVLVTQDQTYHLPRTAVPGFEQVFVGAVVPILKGKVMPYPLAESSLVSMQGHTGAVVALVGGVDWRRSHFNRAVQSMRQPGSSFKPLLVTAALRQGYRLHHMVLDAPFVAKIPGKKDKYWRPMNDDKKFKGPMTLHDALVQSRNLVMVHLLSHMNIDQALDLIDAMGVPKAHQPRSLAMSLGAGSVNPVQMMTAFGVFMNRGNRVYPHLMISAQDQTKKAIDIPFELMAPGVYTRQPEVHELYALNLDPHVLTENEAWSMWHVLQDVVKKGTARRALVLERSDIAGKTGTTNDQNDAWFVGSGGAWVTAVWCGYDQLRSLHAYGGSLALPIWIDYMKVVLAGQPLYVFPKPKLTDEKNMPDTVPQVWMDGSEEDEWEDPDEAAILELLQ